MEAMTEAFEATAGEVRPEIDDEEVVLCECGRPKEDGHLCAMVAEDNAEVSFDEMRGERRIHEALGAGRSS